MLLGLRMLYKTNAKPLNNNHVEGSGTSVGPFMFAVLVITGVTVVRNSCISALNPVPILFTPTEPSILEPVVNVAKGAKIEP